MTERNQCGYTLIEMVVSISIILIMVAVTVGTYTFGSRHDTIKGETGRIASLLRNARARVFNGTTFLLLSKQCSLTTNGCTTDADCTGQGICIGTKVPMGGYGLQLATDTNNSRSAINYFADMTNVGGGAIYVPYTLNSPDKLLVQNIQSETRYEFYADGIATNAASAEITFANNTSSAMFIYESPVSGGWHKVEAGSTYQIFLKSYGIGCEHNQHGQITIDMKTQTITETMEDCS